MAVVVVVVVLKHKPGGGEDLTDLAVYHGFATECGLAYTELDKLSDTGTRPGAKHQQPGPHPGPLAASGVPSLCAWTLPSLQFEDRTQRSPKDLLAMGKSSPRAQHQPSHAK